MIAERGPALIELDRRASEPGKPYGIITADCSSPHEFDDGIAVTPLESAEELYRVRVFAVDTSSLYLDEAIAKRTLVATESRYFDPKDGKKIYEPMLDKRVINELHFVQGTIRKALVVSFLIGVTQPPTNIEVNFGKVEVRNNYSYDSFGKECLGGEVLEPYGRAAALILSHLKTSGSDEEDTYQGLTQVPESKTWRRGATINQAYMVAANHLVGRLMRDEGRLAIYRTHDLDDPTMVEILSPAVARYSTVPSQHQGLGLEVYSRVTSPLRRAEDFMMHGLLKARQTGREVSPRDHKFVTATVRRLNQRIAANLFHDAPHVERRDLRASA